MKHVKHKPRGFLPNINKIPYNIQYRQTYTTHKTPKHNIYINAMYYTWDWE